MKSRNKDHKTHESIIGKIIYGFLLFMPLLAISVTCAYAIFNKNAYQSYADNNNQSETQYTKIENVTDFEAGKTYNLNNYFIDLPNPSQQVTISMSVSNVVIKQTGNPSFINNSIKRIQIYRIVNYSATTLVIYTYDENNVNIGSGSIAKDMFTSFDFTFNSIVPTGNENYQIFNSLFYKVDRVTNDNAISNVFYYSIDKVQQSPLFNWAEDSVIYTGMTNTCNALNITTPFIPLLMTYWLIISVIYILYDIILVILHIFHKKIHQLEDSF